MNSEAQSLKKLVERFKIYHDEDTRSSRALAEYNGSRNDTADPD